MRPRVRLRPVLPADEPLLVRIYGSTREEELARTDWTEQQKEAFVRQQFTAQSRFYVEHYPGAQFQIIEVDDEPAGRLYIHDRADEIRIMDIALLPQFRRKAVGTFLLKETMDRGAKEGKKVTIHVEVFNVARRLYERLGFRKVAETQVYHLMEWTSSMPMPGSQG